MIRPPNVAYIDGDIVAYQTAFWAETGDPSKIPSQVKHILKNWMPKECDHKVICLSCSRSDNFRRELWPDYKAHRDTAYAPEYLDDVKQYLMSEYMVETRPRLEADDVMGIAASGLEGVAVTIDKDLLGVPGWHYNPNKDNNIRFVKKKDAKRFFFTQWMTGDSTDNIPGLWKIGPKKAERFLNETPEEEWEAGILELYESDRHQVRNRGDLSCYDTALIMARCVNILSTKNYDKETEEIIFWEPKVGLDSNKEMP